MDVIQWQSIYLALTGSQLPAPEKKIIAKMAWFVLRDYKLLDGVISIYLDIFGFFLSDVITQRTNQLQRGTAVCQLKSMRHPSMKG